MDSRFSMSFSMQEVAIVVTGLPLSATTFCVLWSLIFNFNESTATHCKVANYLPSISAAIGSYTPQKYVWRIAIAFHCLPRFLLATMYYYVHTSLPIARTNNTYKCMAALCSFLHYIENFSLLVLTYISSTDNHAVHESSFIIFMVSSLCYMFLTCLLVKWGISFNNRVKSLQEKKSLKYKIILFTFNITVFLTSVYVFFRHNRYCEPGVYTIFALLEYLVVFTNMAYHATIVFDLPDYRFQFAPLHASIVNGKCR